MGYKFQWSATLGSFIICILAHLYHVPNSENISQMNRVRLLSASMKIIKFIGFVSETVGWSSKWLIQRNCAILLLKSKPTEVNTNLKIDNMIIEGVPVRFYYPINSIDSRFKLLPAVIYYHGGALYRGSIGESFRIFRYSNDIVNLETHHPITRELAVQTDFIVISVEYLLAPEHPFPVGLDDCTKVTKHILDIDNANKFNIDPTRVAIAGDSVGGNFAAVIATRLTNKNMAKNIPRLQILIYHEVQFFDFMLPSSIGDDILVNNHMTIEQKKQYRPYVDWSLIPSKYRQIYKEPINDNIDGDANLMKNTQQILEPDLSPLLVENEKLSKLPATYVLTVDHDQFRDEGFIYVVHVKSNGVHVTHRHFEKTFHGSLTFLEGIFKLEIAHETLTDIVHYLKDYL
ncbi:unnamed protein product [Rotaria magnacalcarata]|uniref:Alpha/beta hydrolase fold-3 domain-containing protein n=1 Tax=Rotaria magnacalcarata TaxID=392030 RepID=A0A816WGY9_9BILA|nr:unnamed protein product [Rotaria magnacalcarata]